MSWRSLTRRGKTWRPAGRRRRRARCRVSRCTSWSTSTTGSLGTTAVGLPIRRGRAGCRLICPRGRASVASSGAGRAMGNSATACRRDTSSKRRRNRESGRRSASPMTARLSMARRTPAHISPGSRPPMPTPRARCRPNWPRCKSVWRNPAARRKAGWARFPNRKKRTGSIAASRCRNARSSRRMRCLSSARSASPWTSPSRRGA